MGIHPFDPTLTTAIWLSVDVVVLDVTAAVAAALAVVPARMKRKSGVRRLWMRVLTASAGDLAGPSRQGWQDQVN